MIVYRYIFAAIHGFYKRFKSEASPVFSAACVLTLSQVLTLMAILIFLEDHNIIYAMPGKYYWLPILVIWLWVAYKYYAPRTEMIMEEFSNKSLGVRRVWNVVALLVFFVPLITTVILTIK